MSILKPKLKKSQRSLTKLGEVASDPDNPKWTKEDTQRSIRIHQLPESLQRTLKSKLKPQGMTGISEPNNSVPEKA